MFKIIIFPCLLIAAIISALYYNYSISSDYFIDNFCEFDEDQIFEGCKLGRTYTPLTNGGITLYMCNDYAGFARIKNFKPLEYVNFLSTKIKYYKDAGLSVKKICDNGNTVGFLLSRPKI